MSTLITDGWTDLGNKQGTRVIARPPQLTFDSVISRAKRVWLVGLMACGKSSTKTMLAQALNATEVDTDSLIVKEQGKSIGDIFREVQEAGFRLLEKQVVTRLSETDDDTVIATGGGAACFHNNMETMNRSGVTVFLDASPEIVAQRTIDDEHAGKPIRPLVAGKKLDDRIGIFQQQRETRGPFYREAKITIKVDGLSVEETVRAILMHNSMRGFLA